MVLPAGHAAALASALGLVPHPEGGRYRQVHLSGSVVHVPGRDVQRPALTSILFLLARDARPGA